MNTTEGQASHTSREASAAEIRSERVTTVAWLTGVTAVVGLGSVSRGASLGEGLAVVAIAAMVAFVSYLILKS